jgi:hypothetical protein
MNTKKLLTLLFLLLISTTLVNAFDARCSVLRTGLACYNSSSFFGSALFVNSSNVLYPFWLNLSDQRYNDTAFIISTNASMKAYVDNVTSSLNISGVTDGNNYTSGLSVQGSGTKTIYLSRVGMSNLTASFTDNTGAGDGNNYPTGISYQGTTTKTLYMSRDGLSNLTASFSDIDTYNTTSEMLGVCQLVTNSIGNWTSDKTSYNTTVQNNFLFYGLSNPYGYYNSSSVPSFALQSSLLSVGNWTSDKSNYLNTTQLRSSYANTTVNNATCKSLCSPDGITCLLLANNGTTC